MKERSITIPEDVYDDLSDSVPIVNDPQLSQHIRQIIAQRPVTGSPRTRPAPGSTRMPEDLDQHRFCRISARTRRNHDSSTYTV
jgi:hypothetical protein